MTMGLPCVPHRAIRAIGTEPFRPVPDEARRRRLEEEWLRIAERVINPPVIASEMLDDLALYGRSVLLFEPGRVTSLPPVEFLRDAPC